MFLKRLNPAYRARFADGTAIDILPPMDEVLDLRRNLDELLGRYRRRISHLRGELRTDPFDEHIQAEIDAVWRTEVEPAVGEIRQAMSEHRLVKEQLRALRQLPAPPASALRRRVEHSPADATTRPATTLSGVEPGNLN